MRPKVMLVTLGALLLLVTCLVHASQDSRSAESQGQEATDSRAIFVVTNTADAGPGSLRDAINSANANPGNDIITFNIAPPGPHVIMPLSQLPPLTDPAGVFIDGLSQPGGATAGANPPSTAVLLIELNGMAAGPAHGLWVVSSNNHIQGLCINNFEQDGICVESGSFEPFIANNIIYCCFVGTDLTGTADMGNGRNQASLWAGVYVGNQPGGTTSQTIIDANLISGNYAEGVHIEGPKVPGDVFDNHVLANYIGTDISGTLGIGNDHEGVCLSEGTHDNHVLDNLICANGYDGIGIQGFDNEPYPAPPIFTYHNMIMGNSIGLDMTGAPLPNMFAGVAVGEYGPSQWGYAIDNRIENNRIAYNIGAGITVWEHPLDNINADRNTITQNAIFDNGGLGIDLNNDGVTPNDPGDPDSRANEELNFPVIFGAVITSGTTNIGGTIDIDTSPNQATVELFKAALDPTGYGEGAVYLGFATPDAMGNWIFTTAALTAGDSVTATTTDVNGNTSEFSACVAVTTGEEPWDCWENPPPDKVGGGEEMEPNDVCEEANPASCETAYCGTISHPLDEDWWVVTLPEDTCYCLHVRLFGDATPGQYAYGGGLNTYLEIWDSTCQTMIYSNDDYNGVFPDAVGTDSQYDCLDPTVNCHAPGTTLHIRVAGSMETVGPYLLVINCYPCECPQPDDTCEYFKQGYLDYCPNGMPDFDQKRGTWWSPFTGNFSWCGPVSLANCFWWFDSKFEPNPVDPRPFYPSPISPPANDGYPLVSSYDPAGIWDDHDTSNVVPFISQLAAACNTDGIVPGTSFADMVMGANNWLSMVGLHPEYTITPVIGPDYYLLRDSILSSQDVILLLGFYELLDEEPMCQWLGGHYVTSAGVCTTSTQICISDPFFDKSEGDPPPGSAHGPTVHDDASLVSGPHGTNWHDIYTAIPAMFPCPTPATWQLVDYPNQWFADGIFTFESQNPLDPIFIPVQYQGGPIIVLIDAALIICPADTGGCCIPPIRGNVDYDPLDLINISDMTYLVAFLFSGGAAPPCFPEADVNADMVINISDMTYLVAYLFSGGPAPLPCP
jgi:hypothetical protein